MLYILAIILIFFSLPLIGRLIMRLLGWWVSRKITSQARKAYNSAFGGMDPTGFGAYGSPASSASSSSQPVRKKRIDPSVGEYVEYEEIYAETGDAEADTKSTESFVAESQIVDVEWEDIR